MEKSRAVRLLGLLPAFLGLALETMVQVGPGEVEINLCKWVRLLVPNARDVCLHGFPMIGLQLLPMALVTSGLVWLFWPKLRNLAWRGRKRGMASSLADELDAPAFCSLEEAFKLSGGPDREAFLVKIRRPCGLGRVAALGKKNAAMVSHDVIPSADWAAYRLVFANGGCAIPENGDDFLDALAMINLLETPRQDVRIAGWCDLRFKTEEIVEQVRGARN
jgi:hypothetical protein